MSWSLCQVNLVHTLGVKVYVHSASLEAVARKAVSYEQLDKHRTGCT